MRRACFTVLAVLLCAVAASASPIPIFNLTQGTISVSSFSGGADLSWIFSGPGGVSIAGNGPGAITCFNTVLAAGQCDPSGGSTTAPGVPSGLLGFGAILRS